jgi:putative glycosyltransferase
MTANPAIPQLSVVATMYRSAATIAEFHGRISAAAAAITADYEIILVNDGSPDDSADIAARLCAADPHVVLVDLSRNFGHHAAILAGLSQARGAQVYLTDIDLEEQPEWLVLFQQTAQDQQADVVYGVQQRRVGSRLDNIMGAALWKLLNAGSLVPIPADQMTCRLMSRRYLDGLLQVRDKVLYLGGLFPWAGFRQVPVPLVKGTRKDGTRSSYGLGRKLRQAVDSVTSFTAAPLTLFFLTGLAVWIGSIVYGGYIVVRKLLSPDLIVGGFTSLMFSIWFLGGLIIVGIGLLGQYLSKIFQETKDRPIYIIRAVIGRDR